MKRLILLFLIPFFFISCDNDSSTDPDGNGLVGTWALQEFSITYNGETMTFTTAMMGMQQTLTANADGTLTITTTDENGTETETGTWSTSGNVLTATVDGESVNFTYTLSGNTLSLNVPDDFNDADFGAFEGDVVMVYTRR